MAVTFNNLERLDELTFLLTWESDQSTPVTFRVYREGRLVDTIVSADGTAESTFHIGIGDEPFIEVLDTTCQQPSKAYPGRITLNWESISGADTYRIEEQTDSTTWTERQELEETGEGVLLFLSRWLEDSTTHSFRVVPVDSAGNEGTALTYDVLMVRHSDVPQVNYSYDSTTGQVTISE